MDLVDVMSGFIKNEFFDKKILILGCGLSDNSNSTSMKNVLSYITKFKNLTVSDLEFCLSPQIYTLKYLPFNSFEEYKEFFPKKSICLEKISEYENILKDQIKNIHSDCIKERFIPINLLKDSLSNLEFYDYIELRYVIHFSYFTTLYRKEILRKLYTKLSENGQIGIQCYSCLSESRNDGDKYNLISNEEICELCSIFDNISIYSGDDANGSKYKTIIIKK